MKKIARKNKKRIVFDLDGVICTQVVGDYTEAKPIREAVKLVNYLHKNGHNIVIHTARFMGRTGGDAKKAHKLGYKLTKSQLAGWGVKYHKLVLGKPPADILIDDRAIFFTSDWNRIKKHVKNKLNKNA